ncbi:hypothetical protein LMG28138_00981 [Pararobbsia alpina]|uniref:Uncharacterized protein n=1 Tax=Pararobbsia alpina TaxID=621374 RepID=A0A6S7AWP8_9BURK|nr:hypothetical protein LMG28138_00981 [Pararobbsia alpina]
MAERCLSLVHTTILRCVRRNTPEFACIHQQRNYRRQSTAETKRFAPGSDTFAVSAATRPAKADRLDRTQPGCPLLTGQLRTSAAPCCQFRDDFHNVKQLPYE